MVMTIQDIAQLLRCGDVGNDTVPDSGSAVSTVPRCRTASTICVTVVL